jgi:LacI family transcriptional regulator, gluconate utilization system Gnt-I transcriptional repressor
MEAVGRLAGVSQVTVSRALSDPSKVSPKTLERIHQAIAQTGFVPNALAGALAGSRSRLVSVLVPSITNIVYASLVQAFSEGMGDSGYQIMLSEIGFDPQEEEILVATHLSRRPDAMMLVGIRHTARTRRMLLGAGIPVVEVWDMTDSPIDLCVGFSHVETGRAVADFAIEAGYRRPANVSAGDERALRRKDAFAQWFTRRTGTSVDEVAFDGSASLARGREALSRLIEGQGFDGDLIFCSSDLLAQGVLIEARARGLPVPDRIAVVGFGDQDFAEHTSPSITTVRVNREILGQTAARAILGRLAGADIPGAPVFDVGFDIVRRQSA